MKKKPERAWISRSSESPPKQQKRFGYLESKRQAPCSWTWRWSDQGSLQRSNVRRSRIPTCGKGLSWWTRGWCRRSWCRSWTVWLGFGEEASFSVGSWGSSRSTRPVICRRSWWRCTFSVRPSLRRWWRPSSRSVWKEDEISFRLFLTFWFSNSHFYLSQFLCLSVWKMYWFYFNILFANLRILFSVYNFAKQNVFLKLIYLTYDIYRVVYNTEIINCDRTNAGQNFHQRRLARDPTVDGIPRWQGHSIRVLSLFGSMKRFILNK